MHWKSTISYLRQLEIILMKDKTKGSTTGKLKHYKGQSNKMSLTWITKFQISDI